MRIFPLLFLVALIVTVAGCADDNCKHKQRVVNDSVQYYVLWKYKISPGKDKTFEYEYGKNGSWAIFFGRSKDYRGSLLTISEEEPDSYLLIDKWTNQRAYNDFKKKHLAGYNALSEKFRDIYLLEERIGAYTSLPGQFEIEARFIPNTASGPIAKY